MVGIMAAENAMGGNSGSSAVAAGLAVQGEFSGNYEHIATLVLYGDWNSPGSHYGLAQTDASEISAFGLSGSPDDPTVAVAVMRARLEMAQEACIDCTPRDRVIAAALAQNQGITPKELKRWTERRNGEAMNWSAYFEEQFGSSINQSDAQVRENITGVRYPTYFMVLKYTRDLKALYERGWDLPYGITEGELDGLIKWSENQ